MPDILELNEEITRRILGSRVILDVYEWIDAENLTIVACPRVTVDLIRDEEFHQSSIHFSPEFWPDVTPDFIATWVEKEFEDVL